MWLWLHGIDATAVELATLALLLAVAPLARLRVPTWATLVMRRLVRRPRLVVALIGLLGAVTTAALALALRLPDPSVHDEFSYLLAADTYARGRLANPTPRSWPSFETFHVLMEPSYASKYPPGQGLILALGQRLAGHPMVGLWLSVGLVCAAMCWMFQAWVGPRWALVGGLIAVAKLSFSYWGHSYWGGAVAASGGALVYGALARLVRRPAAGDALLFATGLLVLANSRPYEGLVLSLPAGFLLLQRFARERGEGLRGVCMTVVLPAAAVLVVGGVAMVYFNLRVTGEPWTFPYAVYDRGHSATPLFLWQDRRPLPEFHNLEMRRFVSEALNQSWLRQQTLMGYLENMRNHLVVLWSFYVGPALSVSVLGFWWWLRRRQTNIALGALAIFFAGMSLTSWHQPHYAAPGYGLLLVLALEGLRQVRGRFLPRARRGALVPAVLVALLVAQALRFVQQEGYFWQPWPERRQVVARLEQEPGKHLVFVRYTPRHNLHREWVQNGAEFAAQRVLWARLLDGDANARVLAAYPGRRVWLLDADRTPPALRPWAEAP